MSDVLSFVPPQTRPPKAPSAKGSIRTEIRRNLKFAAAFGLLAVGGYALMSGQAYVTCDNAVVSAYTFSLRAPISGYVSGLSMKVGDPVSAGAILVHLTENRLDNQRLVDLTNLLARFRGNRAAYEHERAELTHQRDALIDRAATRDQAEAAYLVLQATEAEREIHLREAARDLAHGDVARKEVLSRTGDTAEAELDESRAADKQADMALQAAVARHAYLQLQANVASRGILLESGSADVSHSSQRADELAMRSGGIRPREISLSDRFRNRDGRPPSMRERQRAGFAARHCRSDRPPPRYVRGKLGASEESARELAIRSRTLVDCGSAFTRRGAIPAGTGFPMLEIWRGGLARVRAYAGETVERVGRVVSMTGEASVANDRNLAAAPPVQRVASATARIEVAASANSARDCLVGRTARVLLPTSADSGLISRVARRFF